MKISTQNLDLMIEGVRDVMKNHYSDLHIYIDRMQGKQSGKSSGYGVVLFAKSTTYSKLCTESIACFPSNNKSPAKDIGTNAAKKLLDHINLGGDDSRQKDLLLILCAIGSNGPQRMTLETLDNYTIKSLKLIRNIMDVHFEIQSDIKSGKFQL